MTRDRLSALLVLAGAAAAATCTALACGTWAGAAVGSGAVFVVGLVLSIGG